MDELQKLTDLSTTTTNDQLYLSLSTHPNIKYRPMPDPLSVYVPLDSLTEETIDSLVSTVQQSGKKDWNNSKRTILTFLLAIHNQVSEIENKNDSTNEYNEYTVQLATQVRRWLMGKDQSGNVKELSWDKLRANYEKMMSENNNEMARSYGAKGMEPYYELTIDGLHPDVNQSRQYMARYRSHGWEPKELKIYWNAQQLENLCPKDEVRNDQIKPEDEQKVEETNELTNQQIVASDDGDSNKAKDNQSEADHEAKVGATSELKNEQLVAEDENSDKPNKNQNDAKVEEADEVKIEKLVIKDDLSNEEKPNEIVTEEKEKTEAKNDKCVGRNLPMHDPSDVDAVHALRQWPVSKRNHAGTITYVHNGIEKAVFDAPENAQLIVLNFANERSPGGGYLRHAWAQEEILLYNSDGYRSLLDLKNGRMGDGYAIPEFGVAYVRDIRVFDKTTDKIRKADMLVSACYCLTGSPQLYDNPKSKQEWITKNVAKFRAFIAAAVANTIGDGSNTYLLLGPIGTGAFGNNVDDIGYVFREVLSAKMMGSVGPIREVFGNIWFVSTDKWKNDRFKEIFNDGETLEVK